MMAKISDKLRKWCAAHEDTITYKGDFEKLCVLANRIDIEMVELPLSADGYIWTGREVCFWTGSANEDRHKFDGLHYSDGRWCVEDVYFERYPAASVWYERPDGLERIADEMDEVVDAAGQADDICEKLANLAERIRRLAAKDKR